MRLLRTWLKGSILALQILFLVLCSIIGVMASAHSCSALLSQPKSPSEIQTLRQALVKLDALDDQYAHPENIPYSKIEIIRKSEGVPVLGRTEDESKKKFVAYYRREIWLLKARLKIEIADHVVKAQLAEVDVDQILRQTLDLAAKLAPGFHAAEPFAADRIRSTLIGAVHSTGREHFETDEIVALSAAAYLGNARIPFAQPVDGYKEILTELAEFTANKLKASEISRAVFGATNQLPSCCVSSCSGCPFSYDLISSSPELQKLKKLPFPILPRSKDNSAPPENELARMRVELRPILGDTADPVPINRHSAKPGFRRRHGWFFWR